MIITAYEWLIIASALHKAPFAFILRHGHRPLVYIYQSSCN